MIQQMSLKTILLNERNQTQKVTHCMSPFYNVSRRSKSVVSRQTAGGQGLRGGVSGK